ncbi:MAG: response regulator [Acidobacteriota bacterium]|nr:response regulator [Acidobacteriota bacterium]
MSQILIADDDPGIVRLLKLLVEREGFLVDVARDGREAVEKIENGSYVLMLLDLQMPRFNGFDVVEFLRQRSKRPVVLVITALPVSQLAKLDPRVVHAIIRKPFDVELLASIISSTAGMMHRSAVVFERREDRHETPN